MRRSGSSYLTAIILLVLAAFVVRAMSLDAQSLWRDEVDALRFATVPWAEMFSNFVLPGWNGPLYFLLLRGWITFTGTSEYAMRFFSLAFGVLCVPLAYVLGRRLFSRPVGLLTALLLTVSPYLTWYGQEVKMYTLVPALALLAVYAQKAGLRRAAAGEGWRCLSWTVVQVVATSLALYTHILAALLIPVQVLLTLAWWPRTRWQWVCVLVRLACVILLYLPLATWQAPLTFQTRETGFHPYTLDQMAQILLNGWSLGILGWGQPWGTVLMSVLAVWGLVSPLGKIMAKVRRQASGQGHLRLSRGTPSPESFATFTRLEELESRLALLGWLVTPLLIVWFISLQQPLFTDRYLIWTAPAFYVLVALGLGTLWRFGHWGRWVAALLAGIILVLNGINLWQQATVPLKSDFRAAAAYIADYHTADELTLLQATAGSIDDEYTSKYYLPLIATSNSLYSELVVFQIPYGRYTFEYYFPVEGYPWTDGLYTNYRAPDGSYLMGEREAALRMQEMTAGHDVFWLVATEVTLWDERGLVQAWLEANAQRVDEAHFMWVDVYRYVR
jgi:mannosyltransferase